MRKQSKLQEKQYHFYGTTTFSPSDSVVEAQNRQCLLLKKEILQEINFTAPTWDGDLLFTENGDPILSEMGT